MRLIKKTIKNIKNKINSNKKIKTKSDKNKWKDKFIFWQGDEREKKKEKKIHQSSISTLPSTWATPLKKSWRDTFKTIAEGDDWI